MWIAPCIRLIRLCLQRYEKSADTDQSCGDIVGVYGCAGQGYIAGFAGACVVPYAAYRGICGRDTVLPEGVGAYSCARCAATGADRLPDGAALGGILRGHKVCQHFNSIGMPVYRKYFHFAAGPACE